MTSMERNRGLVTAYVDAMNAGNFDRLLEFFAPDARIQSVAGAGGLDFVLPIWRQLHAGLNMRLDILGMVAEGERVSVLFQERDR